MKTLIELKIPQIKCENKETSDYVRELQQRANDELYPYRMRPISHVAANALVKTLTDIGVALTDAIVNEKQALRRDEIQSQLRTIIRQLKAYSASEKIENEDISKVQRIMNYFTQKVISAKEKGLSTPVVMSLLRERKEINSYYIKPIMSHFETGLNFKSFSKTEEELLGYIYGEWAYNSTTDIEPVQLPLQKVKENFTKQKPKSNPTVSRGVPPWADFPL